MRRGHSFCLASALKSVSLTIICTLSKTPSEERKRRDFQIEIGQCLGFKDGSVLLSVDLPVFYGSGRVKPMAGVDYPK